jgi:hypothetical protein
MEYTQYVIYNFAYLITLGVHLLQIQIHSDSPSVHAV